MLIVHEFENYDSKSIKNCIFSDTTHSSVEIGSSFISRLPNNDHAQYEIAYPWRNSLTKVESSLEKTVA